MPGSTTTSPSPKRKGSEPIENSDSDASKIKALEEELAALKARHNIREEALNGEIVKITEELRASRGEVKRMQEQDYKSRRKAPTESHDTVSQQFLGVFSASTDWARKYFRIELKLFSLDEHELFKRRLDDVLWSDSRWTKKQMLNVSHLVQAVVAEVLSKRILLVPFIGCADSFRHESTLLYEAMLKENKTQAYKWRATTFSAYERCGVWPPSSTPSTPSEPISRYREDYYKRVADEIESIVGSIVHDHETEQVRKERLQKLMLIIETTANLAIKLGKQGSELRVMDKSWFEQSQRVFACDDERMKGRFAEEDEEENEHFRVDIILRPGFLKFGDDEGENLDRHAVWIPAMLDLRQPGDSESVEDAPLETPMFEAPENPMVEVLEIPMVEVPENQTVQAPEIPIIEVSEIPKVEVPENPAVEAPEVPKVEVSESPKAEAPENPKVETPENDSVMADAPPAQPPLHPHHHGQNTPFAGPSSDEPMENGLDRGQNTPPTGPPRDEPIENGLGQQQRVQSPPEIIESKPQPDPHQYTLKEQVKNQDEPPISAVQAKDTDPVVENSKGPRKRRRDAALRLIDRITRKGTKEKKEKKETKKPRTSH